MLRDLEMDQYAGGTAAIARHLSDFCGIVSLLSMLGEKKEHEEFVIENLPENIARYFIYKDASPTITKKRYVDHILKSKSIGVYSINDSQMNDENQNQLHTYLSDLIPKHDLVIVSDYGHGLISSKSANLICKLSKYLALNAQVNAANVGYHSMRNYKNVDCVIINEKEIRHELRDKNEKINILTKKLANMINITNLIVTRGSDGAILYNSDNKKYFSFGFVKNKNTVALILINTQQFEFTCQIKISKMMLKICDLQKYHISCIVNSFKPQSYFPIMKL